MKQDILIYLLLPFPVLFLITIIASLLQLLAIIDISAQLSGSKSSPPEFEFLFIMIIVYYGIIACIAKNSSKICSAKIRVLSTAKRFDGYGGETRKKLRQLMEKPEFKEWSEKRKNQDLQQSVEKKAHPSKKKKQGQNRIVHHHHNSDSGEDSQHQMQGITCHQMATTKKMF